MNRYELWMYNKSWPFKITIRKNNHTTESFRRKHKLFSFYQNELGTKTEVRILIKFDIILKILTNTIVYRTHQPVTSNKKIN